MKVILFGATGMIGRAVLRECILDADVTQVLAVGRSPAFVGHEKLRNLVHKELTNFEPVRSDLTGYDACFFCLGVTSAGMSEADYTRITHDIAAAAGKVLCEVNPGMTFVFVSGAGTDSTEQGKVMWARVKGKAEKAVLRLPFKACYVFRPALIQPRHGIVSRTRTYRLFYAVSAPIFPLLKLLFPGYVTTTDLIGRAMLNAVRRGAPKRVLENADINALGRV